MTIQHKVVLGRLVVAGAGSENETEEDSGTDFDEMLRRRERTVNRESLVTVIIAFIDLRPLR
jgi:hypothetical protein